MKSSVVSALKRASIALCAMLITVVFVLCVGPRDAQAEVIYSGTCGVDLTWSLDDEGVLSIIGTGEMDDYSVSFYSGPGYNYYKCDSPWSAYSSLRLVTEHLLAVRTLRRLPFPILLSR